MNFVLEFQIIFPQTLFRLLIPNFENPGSTAVWKNIPPLSPQRQPTSTDESISKSSQTVHTGIFSSKL
jgi:hypothetical protein